MSTGSQLRDDRAPLLEGLSPLELLAALVLEDGRSWGEAADVFQWEDAEAFLTAESEAPRRHYLLRGRGMSKTTDLAALALVLLLKAAPPRSRSYAYAADQDQAALLVDSLGGLVQRSQLGALVEVRANLVTVRSTGATLVVQSSDGAGAFGRRPWLIVADELALWPDTANHRKLWSAIVSALAKVKGSRLAVITTAGSPAGLGAQVWKRAEGSPDWRTSLHPGPAPWWTPEDVRATRSDLTPAQWRRLILCEWAEGDDALTTPEDVAACIRGGSLTLPYRAGAGPYVAALDVGTRRDLTALAVGHSEQRKAGRVVVIDRVLYWRPERAAGDAGRVDLSEVEAATLRLCREYRVARLRFDRMQAEQLTGNLARTGVRTSEYVFSATGASKLARGLYVALRDRSLELPDDDELRDEAATVRMVETGPGTVKMSNPPGSHDDVLTAVAMVLADLTERMEGGGGRITVPGGRTDRLGAPVRVSRTFIDTQPSIPLRVAARTAKEAQSRRQRTLAPGLIVPGSANDPRQGDRRSWER